MLKRGDLADYIKDVVDNASCEVSVKIRANVEGSDTLKIAKLIENAGADYLHIDAMKAGIFGSRFLPRQVLAFMTGHQQKKKTDNI